MAEISASTVMKLRKMSGQGMMDCKKALGEAEGDVDKAMEILRKKGLATLEKRAGREASEGKVAVKISDDGKAAAIATLCCETDFVAKSDDFIAAAEKLTDYMLASDGDEGAEVILNTEIDGKKFADVITDTVSKTGEKMEMGDFTRYAPAENSVVGSYVHFNGKIGSLVEIECSDANVAGDSDLNSLANDIAMHIVATNPVAVDRDSVSSEVIEQEKKIAAEQMKDKPANIIDKIVEGKMGKFFAENCLVDQPFVKDEDKKVGQLVTETAKKAGGTAKVKRFSRFEIG
jgi:elongation factor Ts